MLREDLTDKQEQELDDFLYTFNRGVLTPMRRRLGSDEVVKDITDDLILGWSNNWRDAKRMMNWIADQPTASYLVRQESPIVQAQYNASQQNRNYSNLEQIDMLDVTPYSEDFTDTLVDKSILKRSLIRDTDITNETEENFKAKYRESQRYGSDMETINKQNELHLKNWRKALADTIPDLKFIDSELYQFFMHDATPAQVASMVKQDPYVSIEYMYEARNFPILDPDTQMSLQESNIVDALYNWYNAFDEYDSIIEEDTVDSEYKSNKRGNDYEAEDTGFSSRLPKRKKHKNNDTKVNTKLKGV